ncbi:MAG TPA: hypothetical protein PKZ32_17175, partial [Candidatus Melainabacteria bacterium]|nr:hypothetical protein [Candidatus Melainabacteria bacterium]
GSIVSTNKLLKGSYSVEITHSQRLLPCFKLQIVAPRNLQPLVPIQQKAICMQLETQKRIIETRAARI